MRCIYTTRLIGREDMLIPFLISVGVRIHVGELITQDREKSDATSIGESASRGGVRGI